VASIVHSWRELLSKEGWRRVSEVITSPTENEELFRGIGAAVLMERKMADLYNDFDSKAGSVNEKYVMWKEMASKELVEELLRMGSALPSYSELMDQIESEKRREKVPAKPTAQTSPLVASLPKPATSSAKTYIGDHTHAKPPTTSPSKPASHSTVAVKASPSPHTAHVVAAQPRGAAASTDMDDESISDNMSHLSMEVNTTGTGSLKGDELDSVSEFSFNSAENLAGNQGQKSTGHTGDDLDFAFNSPAQNIPLTNPPGSKTGDAELDELLNL
jgi:hypothetical protein